MIYLIGFAGTGKYTIAQAIARIADVKIVDNQLINTPVFRVIYTDGCTPIPAAAWNQIRRIREAVFDTIRFISPAEYSFVFTNDLVDGDPEAVELYTQVEQLARDRRSLFIPVRLLCAVEELCRRVVSPERRARDKGTDPEAARRKAEQHAVFRPTHPHTLSLDVTARSAEQSTQAIMDHVLSVSQHRDE